MLTAGFYKSRLDTNDPIVNKGIILIIASNKTTIKRFYYILNNSYSVIAGCLFCNFVYAYGVELKGDVGLGDKPYWHQRMPAI